MHRVPQPAIKDLALIGDQKSCALIDKHGTVAWYCLWRFDQPSLFSLLVDEGGGYWTVDAPGKIFRTRRYLDDSAVLQSEYVIGGGLFTVTDFMPTAPEMAGICRLFSPSPEPVAVRLFPRPDYGRSAARLRVNKSANTVSDHRFEYYIKGSHPLHLRNDVVEMLLPPGEAGWCVVVDDKRALPHVSATGLEQALKHTTVRWGQLMQHLSYEGPYREQMMQSYKAIQLVRHQHSGGILAAGTTSLPEVKAGRRNYDYRFVWLRDTAMNVSALLRAGSTGNEADRFLDFLCMGRNTNKKNLFVPFYDLDAKTAPFEETLPGTGYRSATPLRVGNNANEQVQLDAQGNVLLAAKEVYNRRPNKPHWKTIQRTAEFLVKHWMEEDHGIWEEHTRRHFTSSKVIVTKSLEFLAAHTEDEAQKKRWLQTAGNIRRFVADHCRTSDGAYAVFAGSENVDVTTALFAIWEFDEANSPVLLQTISRIEAELREGELYHRFLLNDDWRKEGVFLAGGLWMAQYYILQKNLSKAKTIIDATLTFATDLGFLPEEGDIKTGEALGNLPQTFVHASLMGALVDYKNALGG